MAHQLACKRWPLKKLTHIVPPRMYERNLEHNQQVASCCRHTENHMIEAWYSCEEAANIPTAWDEQGRVTKRGVPDIYKIICTAVHEGSERPNGERWHQIFMVGGTKHPDGTHEPRPVWEIR